jgi:hypothetical protein
VCFKIKLAEVVFSDIAMANEAFKFYRLGMNFNKLPQFKWPNKTIPYIISSFYQPSEMILIQTAIRKINAVSCLKFKPYSGKGKDAIIIWPVKYPNGCWSFIGRQGGVQPVSLTPPDSKGNNCFDAEGRNYCQLSNFDKI